MCYPHDQNGGQAGKEFKVNVEVIGGVRRKNLVRLLGFCAEGAHRFMGMKAATFTNNSSLKSFGNKLSFSVFTIDGFHKNGPGDAEQLVDFGASELLKLLGFQEGKTAEWSQYDVVFVHVGAGELEFLNTLVGSISQIEGSKMYHFAAGFKTCSSAWAISYLDLEFRVVCGQEIGDVQ
ncbi:hypothetical protein D8674_023306 [Pyrus ussuriensis x Pyrus communis]|uniref:Uncharacterized protein n=1 Tax=Pyrus ussuriensis x Pyrus communis TaxID=2448454 RepID=A0A5N5GN72_9ROSA|nr:hypothetical protein D8674_023306 [Pyrus ussuriensis x Pyrus communis]